MAENAYIDSAALHARALIDFFIKPKGFPSDIRRTDFAPDWTPAPDKAVARIKKDGWMLNKYLAHMTWERATPSAPSWNYPDLTEDVFDIAEAWCAHLAASDGDLSEYFAGQIKPARAALA
ncbi:hypothetical protein F4692_003158 [Nocardioides cavernae]|uniref:Uncharacterized protein n=1 Tax=Nocardioides cavernae TaxID=1921566 RepID=A0A7Y9H5C1_9ACTN|nr:hypothetical protein [Nocardioides cavernae]NYE38013.1 hypothetical protein [Nocardioides cavernae]